MIAELEFPIIKGLEGHIYVLGFSSGMVKVGFTTSPRERLRTHFQHARIYGVSVTESWISPPHVDARSNERRLIAFCGVQDGAQNDGEYFTGISFGAASSFAQSLPFPRGDVAEHQRMSERALRKRQLDRLEAHDADRRRRLLATVTAAGVTLPRGVAADWLNDAEIGRMLARLWDGESVDAAEIRAAFSGHDQQGHLFVIGGGAS